MRTRCTPGDTERFKIDGSDVEGRMDESTGDKRKKGELKKKRGRRGERAFEVLTETK